MDPSTEPGSPPPPTLLGYESSGRVPAKLTARVIFWAVPAVIVFAFGVLLLLNPYFEIESSLGLGVVGTPVMPLDVDQSDEALHQQMGIRTAGYLVVLLLAQWFFLFPRGRLTLHTHGQGRSAVISARPPGWPARC